MLRAIKVSYSDVGEGGVAVNCERKTVFPEHPVVYADVLYCTLCIKSLLLSLYNLGISAPCERSQKCHQLKSKSQLAISNLDINHIIWIFSLNHFLDSMPVASFSLFY